ncbi:MAG TPA: sigma-70 family RNA polymerase sigma factor, partial [Clostridiaceae bacterium]
NSLLRMCFLYLKDIHLAEDAVQDAFIKVNKSYINFKGDSEEKTWVMRIAINVCKNYLRSSWWKRIDEAAVLENITVSNSTDALQDEALLLEIMKLSPKYKEVILLFYYQDMKICEIAEVLNIPETTISVRLMRAREILKIKLKGWYYDE